MSKYCTVYFLTGDRVWLELSFCCILWLVARLTPRFFFLTVGRLLCLTIVPSISDWWQLLALFEYCTIFFWLVTDFVPVWVLYHLFLTGERFWPCLSIVPSFSDWWQVVLFEYIPSFFWEVTGFGSVSPSFSDRLQVLALFEYCTIIFRLVTGLFCLRIAPSFSNCWQVLALFEYFTIFFWLLSVLALF